MADSTGKMSEAGIPVVTRLFFYGMLGFSTEVMFTALWYVLDSKYNFGWTLHGCTSVWAFPIYAVSMYAIEQMFLSLHTKVPLAVRGMIYVSWAYLWEFTTGYILRLFAACPWDYHDYTTYHVMGLITFDYAPLWYIGTIILEIIFIKRVLLLQYSKLKDS